MTYLSPPNQLVCEGKFAGALLKRMLVDAYPGELRLPCRCQETLHIFRKLHSANISAWMRNASLTGRQSFIILSS